jgi:hypothetical protein
VVEFHTGEWLYGATCGAADVDGERPVILQEERDGRGLARRLRDRYFAKVFADAGGCPGRTRERNSQLQRLLSRPFSTRFG